MHRTWNMVNIYIQKKRGINMGNLKNILQHCKEHEREYAENGEVSRERDRNQGWIECSEFFLRNFHLTEKTIIENSPVGAGFAQKDNKKKGD